MLLTIITFIFVLSLLVFAHELGHFITAKRNGVKVEEVGFCLPPRAIGIYKDKDKKWRVVGPKTKKEVPSTIYSLNWIPLGGFVKIKGEQGEDPKDKDSFVNRSVGRRIWIISSGVLMNIVLAAVLLSIGLTIGSPQLIEEGEIPAFAQVRTVEIRVLEVLPASPAEKAGLKVADTIISIDGQSFTEITEIQNYLEQKIGSTVNLSIQRKDETKLVEVVPEVLPQIERGGIGVALAKTGLVSFPWYLAWWYGLVNTFKMIGGVIFAFYIVLKNLIVSKVLVAEVYGPVGIATLVGDAARLGFLYLLQFTAALSIIIAVINFLPFPALDGGRVLFLLIEAVRGRAISQKVENFIHNLGFVLLILLVLLITYRDISRVSGKFLGLWQKFGGLF